MKIVPYTRLSIFSLWKVVGGIFAFSGIIPDCLHFLVYVLNMLKVIISFSESFYLIKIVHTKLGGTH